jgi:hypothetical protein
MILERSWTCGIVRPSSENALHLFAGWAGGLLLEVGVPGATCTTPPSKLDESEQAEFKAKVAALSPSYRTKLLERT